MNSVQCSLLLIICGLILKYVLSYDISCMDEDALEDCEKSLYFKEQLCINM